MQSSGANMKQNKTQQTADDSGGQNTPWVSHAVLRQRASIRKTVPCTVQVRVGKNFILATNIHDLSLTGVCLEMNTRGLLVGDNLEVRMVAAGRPLHSAELTLPAEVVRVDAGGAALRFGGYANRTYTDLVNLLYAG